VDNISNKQIGDAC